MRQRIQIRIIFFFSICTSCLVANAQITDSGSLYAPFDHLQKGQLDSPAIYPKPNILHQAILPATLIVYGIVALKTDALRDWNEELHDDLWAEHPHRLTTADNYLQWAPAAAVFGLNFAGIPGEHNFADRSILYGMTLLIEEAIVVPTKLISREIRPNGAGTESFPSGHTANAFAGAEFFRREYKNLSPLYSVAAFAVAGTTGFLRMYNNKHWLSDVVAGAGVGILSTDLSYFLFPVVKKIFFKHHGASGMLMPTYENKTVGLAFLRRF